MKKIYTFLVAGLLAGSAASAQVVIGETTYATIDAAADAAQEGDVINVTADVTIRNRVNLDKVNNVTIQAADGVTISCLVKNKLAFLVKKTATLKNLNLVYTEKDASNQPFLESSSGTGKLTVENCKISNFRTTNGQGVFSVKSSGNIHLNNVTVSNITVPEGKGELFLGGSGSSINGNTNVSVCIQNNYSFTAGPDFAPASPIQIFLDGTRTAGSNIVLGTTDLNKFELQSSSFELAVKGNNIIVAEAGTTGIDDIVAADDAAPVYYNLQGVRVDNPENGMFIKVQGGKTSKVIIR